MDLDTELRPLSSAQAPIYLAADPQQSANRPREGGMVASDGQEFSLPQADGGKDAWLFLASCFMVEALIWGEQISAESLYSYPDIMPFEVARYE